MNIQEVVSELKAERARIDKAIALLDDISSDGLGTRMQHNRVSTRTQKRHHLSAESRRRISEMMKKRWAERRKKAAAKR